MELIERSQEESGGAVRSKEEPGGAKMSQGQGMLYPGGILGFAPQNSLQF